jgi:FMN-dependent oxidoreductase (nitrilotriacetate monooxygenase family)
MKQMHLAGFCSHIVQSNGLWRHPKTSLDFLKPKHYQEVASILERGKFDIIFFGDSLAIPDRHGKSLEFALKHGSGGTARLDPILVASIIAVSTEYIGIGVTRSATYYHPFDLARIFATLDHLSFGRAAWNVVTSSGNSEAQNFGFDQHLEHDIRYDRADEFMEVAFKLWNSWEKDSLCLDKQNGIFADPSRVNYVHHLGKWFASRGPLTVPRSPQGRPVIIQAGSSERGKEFAARWAEVIFEIQLTPDLMKTFYQDVKSRMKKYGRHPQECKILTTVMPFVGETEAIAQDKQSFYNELGNPLVGLSSLSSNVGYDFSQHSLDEPLRNMKVKGSQGLFDMVINLSQIEGGLTLGDAGKYYGRGFLVPQIVGTASQVADQLEALFKDEACDGFMISPAYLPGAFTDFVDFVVPELQKRGLFRTQYVGKTLRERMARSVI